MLAFAQQSFLFSSDLNTETCSISGWFHVSLRLEVAEYGAKRPNPVNIQSWMSDFAQPKQLAEFLCNEMPIRYAERIRCIEPGRICAILTGVVDL